MRQTLLLVSAVMVITVHLAAADMYLHNPRGSNNRLDEANRDRTNARRLFDSQNNNRGGYNVGGMYYYIGSVLSIEWTNQHSCNTENNNCEIIIQYMCEDKVRDGATTSTIPETPLQCDNVDCNGDLEYGMHEDYDYYLLCRLRQRNKGLFLANQVPSRGSAKYTRQNRRGTRNGYECPEERDYYPYWGVSPWRDIVIMTNDQSRCDYYLANSFNNNTKSYCSVPNSYISSNLNDDNGLLPINKEECEMLEVGTVGGNATYGVWTTANSFNIAPPICMKSPFSRDNHLGNGLINPGFPNTYNWTIPDNVNEHCVLRIRYNISTQDYEAWDDIDSRNNSRNQRPNERGSGVDIGPLVGLSSDDAERRGYIFENNPEVDIFDYFNDNVNDRDFRLRLAINTAQFGRTFQDRSHVFSIRARPEGVEGRIFNLNVRGKRGNIVQVYPGVEYDFVPNRLSVAIDDYIHVQWTGSNTNPNNNDGQGRRGTDRSNIVLLKGPGHDNLQYPQSWLDGTQYGWWSRNYPESLDAGTFLGMTVEEADQLATLTNSQLRGEMSELDDAGTYYDLGLYKITKIGTYYYLCTRNNNFTNRSQKGVVIATLEQYLMALVGVTGTVLQSDTAMINVPAGAYSDGNGVVEMIRWTEGQAMTVINGATPTNSERLSEFIQMSLSDNSNTDVALTLMLNQPTTGYSTTLYRAGPDTNYVLYPVTGDFELNSVTANTQDNGIYVAYGLRTGVIAGSVVGVVLLVALLIALLLIIYFSIYPKYLKRCCSKMRTSFTFASRSVADKV